MANKAQVNFKRGTFDNLKALKAANGILDGTFYLTTDTNRLYIGVGTSEYHLINESINLIEKIDTLPAASEANYGKIYLSISENVLAYCRKKGENDYEWVQVNPDTNYITRITNIETPEVTDNKTIDVYKQDVQIDVSYYYEHSPAELALTINYHASEEPTS